MKTLQNLSKMAYSEHLANHMRNRFLVRKLAVDEKKMFGGLSFLYMGKMTVGIVGDELAVRVISSKMEKELEKHQVRPMDFTKRPMKEFIYVEIEDLRELDYWIDLGLEHAKSKLK